ncbi:serine-rich adhesin for platelets-like [Haliotis cracherodii]|uniref:serine-rich adhesin for platelets-like n=1 Tax=Haliotis cracherodii TaxID=6455 RepID=UPI0039E7C152
MRTVKEVTIVFLVAFVDVATTTPTLAVRYTLYSTTKTWNEARAICESYGQQMVKLDTEDKYENFLKWTNIWTANAQITKDIWTGLHQRVLSDPGVFNLEWHDCEPVGAWGLWESWEPNHPETEKCIRLHVENNYFRSVACDADYQVVCQESAEVCTFERFENQDVLALGLASSNDASINDCQLTCLAYTGSSQCVAIVYDSQKSSAEPCKIYTRQRVYINDNPEMTSSSEKTVMVKRCVEGDYKSSALSVNKNTDTDPITACPVMSSTSIMSSESVSVSPTYPGTTVTNQLSALTITHSEAIYSSYTSFSESDLANESLSTSANTFPETTSVASSMTSSSMNSKNAFGGASDTSAESHLTSTMSSHMQTSIILYASTSPAGFIDSTTLNMHWSIDNVASYTDSTMANTASESNAVPSVTLTMTMSESSQITTSPDVVDSATSEGTKPSSIIVSVSLGLESSIHVSNQVVDTPCLTSSIGSITPSECHCVCTSMHPLTSMIVNAFDNRLDRKNLSSYRRSKTSAKDHRPSAKAIGGTGITIIAVVTALVVCLDVDGIIRATARYRQLNASSA